MKMKRSLITLLALLSASGVDIVVAAQAHTTKTTHKKKKSANQSHTGNASHPAHTASKHGTHHGQAAAQQDTKANTATMLELFKNSLAANILSDQQKAYVQGTLIPTLEQELNGTPFTQAIDAAFAQPNASATIQALQGVVQANQGNTLDAAGQHALGQALKDLVDSSVHLDPNTIASLAQLIQQASANNLLPAAMLPDLKANLPALAPMPNPFNTALVAGLQNPQEKIAGMQALVDKAGGHPMDQQTQNAFAGALQGLVNNAHLLDPQDMIRLSMLLGSASTSTILTAEQQQYVQNQLVPAVQVPTTKDAIDKIMASGTPAEQMAAIQNLMDQNSGVPLDPGTQNAFAQALNHLAGQTDKMTPQEKTVFTNLLGDATSSTVLSPAQKDYVKKTMLPTVAPTPTVDAINQAMSITDPVQKIEALKALMAGADGKTIDPAVQNAYAQALQTLQANTGSMSPKAQAQLAGLLSDAGKSPVLSQDQKDYVNKTMLPSIVPPATAGNIQNIMQNGNTSDQLAALEVMVKKQGSNPADPATQEAYNNAIQELTTKAQNGQLSADEAARLQKLMAASGQSGLLNQQQQAVVAAQSKHVGGTVTPDVITAITQGGNTPGSQIDALTNLIKQQGNKQSDPATQNAFAGAIQDLLNKNKNGQLSPADKIKLQQLIEASAQSGLLGKDQQKFVRDQAGNIGATIDAGSIDALMQGSASPSDQLDNLNFILKHQGTKPADTATQNTYAKAIQDLLAKNQRGELSPADKIKLQKLLADSGQTGLLSPDQQKFVASQAGNVGATVDAGAIESVVQNSKSAADQLDNLLFIAKNQGGKPANPATQEAFANAIQDLTAKNKRGELSPADKLKLQQLIDAAGQSGLLNPDQQKAARTQAGNLGTQVDAGSIQTLMQNSATPSDQINNLQLLLTQQGGKPADAVTQNAFANAIQDLLTKNKNGQLSAADKLKLQKLLAASGQSGLLSKDQQKFVATQTGTVGAAIDAGSIDSLIQSSASPSDQLDNLDFLLKQQGNKPADAATQNAYAKAIQDLIAKNQRGELSPADKIKLKHILVASGKTGLLSPDQQKFVLTQADSVGATIDAGAIETLTQGDKSPSAQLDTLDFIVKQQGNKPADAATQNAYAKAIQDLIAKNQRGELSPADKIKLKKLIDASGQSGLLNPEQQKFVREKTGNIGGQVDASTIETLIQDNASPSDQIDNLSLILKQQGSKPADKATQAAYAKAIQDLMAKNQRGELSPADKIKLQKLLIASGQTGLLSPDQQKFVRDQAGNVGATIDAGSIDGLIQSSKSPSDQLDNLDFILKQQGNKPADPSTQAAYAKTIQELIAKNQRGELSPADKIKLKKILIASGQTGLLTPDQQKFVRDQAVTIGTQVDAASVETIAQESGSNSDQLDNLDFIMQQQGGKPADAATQAAYAKTLKDLINKGNRGELSPTEKAKLNKLIKASGKSGLLSPDQQKAITANVSNEGGNVSPSDVENIAQNGGSASNQIDQLTNLLNQQGSKPADKATQAAYAKTIQDLMAKNQRGELSPAEKIKLKKLLIASGKSGLLTADQQKFVADQSDKIGATVDATSIDSLMQDATSPSDQIDNLTFILKQQGNNPADPATQNAYAKAIQDLLAKNQRGELSPTDKIKLKKLLIASGKGGLLSADQQKFVAIQADSVDTQVNAENIDTLMQESKSNKDQLDNLKFIMKQQGGKPADKATQAAYAKTIQDLIAKNKRGELSPDEQDSLQKLIADSAQSGLLDQDQQQLIKTQAAEGGGSANGKKKKGKRKTSPAAESQLANLEAALQQQNGQPADPATQEKNLKLIQDLVAKQANGELSADDSAKLQTLLQNAQKTGAVPKGSVNDAIEQIINDLGPKGPAKYTGTDTGLQNIAKTIQTDSNKTYSPEEQNNFAAKLQSSFSNINTMNDHDKDEFRNMLQVALTTGMLSPEQKAYVKNTMIPQLTKAVMKQLDDLDNLLSGGSLQGTPDEQNTVADRIMKIFKNRPRTNIPYLMQFRAIIVAQLTGPLLSDAQKQYIQTVIIPALDLDINGGAGNDTAAGNGKKRRTKQRADQTRLDSIGDGQQNPQTQAFRQEADAVSSLFDQNKGKQLTAQEQNDAATRLQSVFDNRPQDTTSLEKTKAALQKALDSGTLTPEQNAHVTKLLQQVTQEAAQAVGTNAKAAQEADAVGALFDQNKGKSLSPQEKNDAATKLQAIFDNRPQNDFVTLEKTKDALQKALDSGTLTPEQNAHVTKLLQQVTQDAVQAKANTLDAKASSSNPAMIKDIATLAAMIDPTKKYTPEEQNAIAAKIQDLFSNRSTNDPASLQSLIDVLNQALNSGALSDAQKEFIRNVLLPQLNRDLTAASGSSSRGSRRRIQVAPDAPTPEELYSAKIDELTQFITNARQNTTPALQVTIASLIQNLFDNRPKNSSERLTRLAQQLTQVKQTSLVQKSFMKSLDKMIDTISKDQQNLLLGIK